MHGSHSAIVGILDEPLDEGQHIEVENSFIEPEKGNKNMQISQPQTPVLQ